MSAMTRKKLNLCFERVEKYRSVKAMLSHQRSKKKKRVARLEAITDP